ncbi:exodeoxyribonuclease VII large subunit [Bythopirellula polymerisocia]|uniref:Exodeoxyribonuclease 7 large subunit n=1 Tax=Bythopirellula polymerisocia TaxID=2528003 RepID=A0A5C6CFV9_9BACT|nr:exodeoxyribonuclease VII large subunit [Bythopirellula polymerisocia]TWU23823.1 Exodeoxyribonuclease 7 large subunit [Bythopirellula polymerisocia]
MPTNPLSADNSTDAGVLSVSQLTAQLKGVVETRFSSVWVAGELSNFSRPQSGHCYFTLKDDAAQLRGVVWKNTAARLKFELADGLEIVCRGHLDVYPPRGSYQLVVEEVQPRGVGALELALRKLREKLAAEGLFDADRKRPLPAFPRRIGFVTSPTGAAIRDFVEVLDRRWRGVEVLIFPSRVQGDGAAAEIAAGIRLANRVTPVLDVLVVGRGGGSLEDLWCFNEEVVVRAIAASRIPTISAVGHEIDVTLADHVADVRALTPSEAAERVVPSAQDVSQILRNMSTRIERAFSNQVSTWRQRLESLASRPALSRPEDAVRNLSRQVDEFATRLQIAMKSVLRDQESRLANAGGKLDSLNPLAVLERGYSLTQDRATKRLITSAKQIKKGQSIVTRLAEGAVISTVEEVSTLPSAKTK